MEASRIEIVYAASERGGRPFLSRIGVAFIGAVGALNIELGALPPSGELRVIDDAPGDAAIGVPRAPAREWVAPPG